MTDGPDGAAERFRAIGAEASGVAHDLNNVLAAILAVAEEALADPALDRSPAAAGALAEIRAHAARGATLLRALLAPGAAPDAAGAPVLALDGAVRAAAPLLRRLLGPRVELVLGPAPPPPGVHARIDPGSLERVLTNLAVNARDAMGENGRGTVAIGVAEVEVAAGQTPHGDPVRPGRYARVDVTDDGAGMDAALLGRAVAPFVTTKPGGTGLGLAVARDLLGRAGGFLVIESAPGRGTRARAHLPLAAGAAAVGAARGGGGAGRTVLLVEDEGAIRRLAERALGERGWRVLAAANAADALALLRPEPAGGRAGGPAPPLALLISDLSMPGQDGLALLAALRRDRPGLPAILVSGYADAALRRACAEAGAALLAKPYGLRLLLEAAETVAGGAARAGAVEARPWNR